ncbi:DUF4328 domain-containing protein [Actinopolyspora lacussalsi]|uniref:DUF4328 domain-containing protein n=1 Tax=Actinopolyspora righensis TaxID=995060 RepID=UPI00102ACBAA|nr:DUF4328 domain-containing protein [Actinopolyspora righensis]
MNCAVCGGHVPADQEYCAVCGGRALPAEQLSDLGAVPPAEPGIAGAAPPIDTRRVLRPTRGLGIATIVLLLCFAVFQALYFLVQLRLFVVYSEAMEQSRSYWNMEFLPMEGLELVVGVLSALVLLPAMVLFLVWLFRVRGNAEVLDPGIHRRRKPWLILGWIVPVVNFWFPKQILTDIWRASRPGHERGGMESSVDYKGGLLWAWWLFYLAMFCTDRHARVITYAHTGSSGNPLDLTGREALAFYQDLALAGFLVAPLQVSAAILAVLVVRRITNWQHELREGRRGLSDSAGALAPR